MYTKQFKDFVDESIKSDKSDKVKNRFVGTGNPNSQILLVGKESASIDGDKTHKKWYDNNANDWKEHIIKGTSQNNSYDVDENHDFRKRKSWGKNTWSKYQKLKYEIYQEEIKPNHIDFLEKTFTTEINDAPSKTTQNADKSTLNERKKIFEQSAFIQSFPVVVLACSDYIKNNDEIREIDSIFKVKYEDSESKVYSPYNWFFTHYNDERSKLVIHTRQLSANVKNELLKDMGSTIRKFMIERELLK
jgi:hypothetical protein